MRFRSKFAQIGLALLLSTGAASAEQIAKLQVGNWSGGAYTNDKTGQFSHCAASASYQSGILLVFSISDNRTWSMGFSSKEWQLSAGSTYPVRYWVDAGRVLEGTATAKTPKIAQVILPTNSSLFGAFRFGSKLTVAAQNQTLQFRLTSTSELLDALLECANTYNRPRQGANPFGGNRAPAPQSSNPFGNAAPPSPAPAPVPPPSPARSAPQGQSI